MISFIILIYFLGRIISHLVFVLVPYLKLFILYLFLTDMMVFCGGILCYPSQYLDFFIIIY
ncbi:hypothetical protein BJ944DRAFT_27466 [Cunninghamella echinulata]|nr:hypothetical protein BJ944DRAFT_27466 [Cunninghamella echinulata]